MKKLGIIACCLLFHVCFHISAQETQTIKKLKRADFVSLQFIYDIWQGVEHDVIPDWRQFGFSLHLLNDIPLGTTNFAFAFGSGLSTHNFHSNAFVAYDSSDRIHYLPIPEQVFNFSDSTLKKIQYKNNKHNFVYYDALAELRFRTKSSRTFKFYAGFLLGILIHEHTKYVGDDYLSLTDYTIKYKEYKHRNLTFYRYGPYVKIGISRFTLFGFYSLTSIYKKDKGPEMTPISAGISVFLF